VIDQTLLGTTVAKCMDSIEADPPESEAEGDCELVAVGLVVICSDGSHTWTRTFCSPMRTYEQVGLFSMALECAKDGD
jgi:hypothetical protein